ncbi:developmental pluripotency-associated protein 2-like isoform X2 [Dendronephthya gigantea]|nr:developmental pluripotency-associated protein 2-like isoform X2 [Dendronephthya gigantea]
MGCRMTKGKRAKKNVQKDENHIESIPDDLESMKRKDLQKLCKTYNLKANGKNSELVERLRCHFNTIKLTDIGSGETEAGKENVVVEDNGCDNVDVAPNKVHQDECDENVNTLSPAGKPGESAQPTSNTSSPKDWNWLARWCVVDGVLKQDAAERWVQIQLVGGRPLIIDTKTKERYDFVLEPTILPTPEEYEDNYICGDCVRKNHEKLSGWIGIRKSGLTETPKSSLGKENLNNNSLLRQSFKRKREDVISPNFTSEFIDLVDTPNKLRRLNPQSCSPASPQVRRDRGEDFQLPKNLLKPFKPKKAKKTPPKEDPDYAQKVEKIITDLSPEEQRNLVFGLGNSDLPRSPPHTK